MFCFVLIENESPSRVGNRGSIHRSSQSIHFSRPIHHRPEPFRSLYLHCGALPSIERYGVMWRLGSPQGAVVDSVPVRLETSKWDPIREEAVS